MRAASVVVVVGLVCAALAAMPTMGAGLDAGEASFFGYSGLIAIPTADVLPVADLNVSGSSVPNGNDLTVFGANAGLPLGLEGGLAVLSPEHGGSNTELNLRWHIPGTGVRQVPSIAIGAVDLTNEVNFTPYAVLSASLAEGLGVNRNGSASPVRDVRGHIGLGSADHGGTLDGVFGGVSVLLGSRVAAMGEFDADHLHIGARVTVLPGLRAQAALMDTKHLALGLSYRFRLPGR